MNMMENIIERHTTLLQLGRLAIGVFVASFVMLPLPVRADCINPAAVAGVQIYNGTYSVMQYCNGTSWISMDGSVSVSDGNDNMGDHTATKNLNMSGFAVTNLPTPTANSNAATKAYVDGLTGAGNEIDPQVGTLTNNMRCKGTGTAVQCTYAAPTIDPVSMFFAVDEKADGTDGGASVANTWTTRAINTVKYNDIGASLAGNQITLPAGLYFFDAATPFYRTDGAQTRLIDTSDSSVLFYGWQTWADTSTSDGNAVGFSYLRGIINNAAPITVAIQYNSQQAIATTGLGRAVASYGVETYTTVAISRIGGYDP